MIDAFKNLTELQLNGTLITWLEMQTAIADMPNLRLVEMGYNKLATLSPLDNSLPTNGALQVINLDSNLCSDWVNVCESLQQYVSLERVLLTSNCIGSIPLPTTTQQRFYSLKHISLSFNNLNTWGDVDALSFWCPALETLTLCGNPLIDREVARYTRPITVAKLPSLLALDGALIPPKERTDSEIFYLSHVMQQLVSEDQRVQAHPQWLTLCAKHGRPDKSPNSQALQDKLSNRLIALNLYRSPLLPFDLSETQISLESSEPVVLHVLPTMSLRTLRMKVCKVTKERNADIGLWLILGGGLLRKLQVENDSEELDWLGLEDGSSIMFHIAVHSRQN